MFIVYTVNLIGKCWKILP